MNRFANFQKQNWPAWTADAVALIGLLAYLLQSIIFAHTTISNLDEGAYLLKGFLFATGKYHPFDPGISTNKAPLAFLIPGYVQLLFGAGLRTGRYLAVFFGAMTVFGTWMVARRIGGKWLAAGAVWVFACSPMVIKIYSGGATQSTVACLLAWMLVLSLGEKRPLWQLMLSGLLAGLMMLVRQNMVPVLPLLAIYAFWQHGWKAASGLLISGLAVVVLVHILYWPAILQIWAWLPMIRLPAQVTYSGGGTPIWAPEIFPASRVLSVFQSIRFHFAALVGSILSLLLWPKLSGWKSRTDFRMGLFLLVLFWGLFFMHAMAAIGQDYCVFCLTPYVAFFNVAGILLAVVSIRSWIRQPAILRQTLIVIVFFIIFAGMGFSAFEDIGSSLLKLPAPRMRDLRILPGLVTVWDILSNKFQLDYNQAMRYVSAAFGFAVGGLILLTVYLVWRRAGFNSVNWTTFFSSTILILGIVLSPVLHGSAGAMDCHSDIILDNEQIGAYLRGIIPQGSSVYWDGGLSAAPLLYLPGVKIFPAQINNAYSFISNGDTAELSKFGFWNEELKAEWKTAADFFIIEDGRYDGWKEFFTPEQFDEFQRTPIGTSCLKESNLRIFRRK